ncbi:MAG: hypothetical protein OXP28_09700 [Gammaproteobacteria bacterium]|nr:hypothetical protein [Gammaproteobacteria bacterium]
MAEQDTVPTARMHWSRLVLGGGHPFIVIIVLTIVGAGICWFSLQKISSITQTPTRYVMFAELNTEGCADVQLELNGDIGSFDVSFLRIGFYDDNRVPVLGAGCWVRSFFLRSNLALQPFSFPDGPELVRVEGGDLDALPKSANGNPVPVSWRDVESVAAMVVDGALRATKKRELNGTGPSFSMRVEGGAEEFVPIDFRRPNIHYEITFVKEWQPTLVSFAFVVPENVRTYFEMWSGRSDRAVPEDVETPEDQDVPEDQVAGSTSGEDEVSFNPLDISVAFRTDEVLLVRGMMSDSGIAESVDGSLRFGIENSDAESQRESGTVRYSAVLGIGIALIVEAFVILLAIAMRALAARLGIAVPGRPVGGNG